VFVPCQIFGLASGRPSASAFASASLMYLSLA
jgi:hypothetical protein